MAHMGENHRSGWDQRDRKSTKLRSLGEVMGDTRRRFGTNINTNQRAGDCPKSMACKPRDSSSPAQFRKPGVQRMRSIADAMDISQAQTPVRHAPQCMRVRSLLPKELTEDDITEMLMHDEQSRPMSHLPPYMYECYLKLRNNEEDEQLPHNFMRRVQKDLTNHMRLILVDWVVEVCEAYRLSSPTLQLSVALVDRYLSQKPIARTKLQLLGITAMMLASKVVEIYPPTVGDFVYISDNTYSKQAVLEMEGDMFQTLHHKATLTTPNDMLGPFGVLMGADEKTIKLASFTIELSMLENFSQKARPSEIALAALFLALRTLGHDGWKKELTEFSRYSLFDIMMLLQQMHTMLMQPRPRTKFNAVIEKYSSSKQLKAALIPCPPWVEIIAGCTATTCITSG